MDGVAEGPPAPAKAEGAACALPGTRPGTRASFERPPGAAGRPGPGVVRVSLEAKAEAGPEAQPEAGRPGAAPAAPRGARRAVRSGGRDPGARGEAQGRGSALGRTGGGARPGHGCSGGVRRPAQGFPGAPGPSTSSPRLPRQRGPGGLETRAWPSPGVHTCPSGRCPALLTSPGLSPRELLCIFS